MMTITDSLKWRDDPYKLKFINPGAMSQHDYPHPSEVGPPFHENLPGPQPSPSAHLIFLEKRLIIYYYCLRSELYDLILLKIWPKWSKAMQKKP
jgi:hypothetical protein